MLLFTTYTVHIVHRMDISVMSNWAVGWVADWAITQKCFLLSNDTLGSIVRCRSSSLRATGWRPSVADWGDGMSVLQHASNCSLAWAMDGRIMHHGIISSCQSAATSEIVKRFWSRVCVSSTRPLPLKLCKIACSRVWWQLMLPAFAHLQLLIFCGSLRLLVESSICLHCRKCRNWNCFGWTYCLWPKLHWGPPWWRNLACTQLQIQAAVCVRVKQFQQ